MRGWRVNFEKNCCKLLAMKNSKCEMKTDDMHTETLVRALPPQYKISLSSLWQRRFNLSVPPPL